MIVIIINFNKKRIISKLHEKILSIEFNLMNEKTNNHQDIKINNQIVIYLFNEVEIF